MIVSFLALDSAWILPYLVKGVRPKLTINDRLPDLTATGRVAMYLDYTSAEH